jgi:hypothetical protein
MSWTPAPSNALCGLSSQAAPVVSPRPKDVTCAACLDRLARDGIHPSHAPDEKQHPPHVAQPQHLKADAQEPDERRSRGTARACSIAVGLGLGIALLGGCQPSVPQPTLPRGESCVRYCYPLPLQGIDKMGFCECGSGPVCATGRTP